MSRQVYLLGWGLALLAGAFLLTDALLWEPGVTQRNIWRVRPGMSRAEIARLLGGRGISMGFYPPPSHRRQWNHRFPWMNKNRWENVAWVGLAGGVEVTFDESGRAVRAYRVWNGEPGPIARLRAWLGW